MWKDQTEEAFSYFLEALESTKHLDSLGFWGSDTTEKM